MHLIRKFVCYFGVALCVTPNYASIAFAQQGNDQARMLLEMQAMRQEIAELRDMVERQAYQLKRMQKNIGTNLNTNPNGAVGAVLNDQAETSQPLIAQQSASQGSVSQVDSQNQYGNPIDANQTLNEGSPPSTGQQIPEQQFYRTYQPSADNQAVSQDSQSVMIEERTIGQTPNNTVSRIPPVEERIIGQTNNAVSAPITQPNSSNGIDSQVPVTQPSIAAGTGGVIAVPSQSNTQQAESSSAQVLSNVDVPQVNNGADVNSQVITQSDAVPTPKPVVTLNQNSVPVAAPDTSSAMAEQDYYNQGFELLKQSKHQQAVDVFKKQIEAYPNGDLVDDAHYWIAESMYVNRSLEISKQYFKMIIDKYKQSPRVPDAMLKTAYIEQEQGNQIEARILLQEIIQFHPRSNAAISAKNRLADLG